MENKATGGAELGWEVDVRLRLKLKELRGGVERIRVILRVPFFPFFLT